MKIPKWVDAYLLATRMHSPEKVAPDSYERVKNLAEAFEGFRFPSPSVIATYSYNAFPEIITNGYETYIVYDLFLNECAQCLNHLLRSLPNEFAVQSFCLNIIVKRLIQANASRSLILFLSQTAADFGEICTFTEPDSIWKSHFPDLSESFLIEVQEAYAVYHELAHYLLCIDDVVRGLYFKEAKISIKKALNSVDNYDELLSTMELQQRLSNLFDEPEGFISDLINRFNQNDLENITNISKRGFFPGKMKESSEKAKWLINEVACDKIATFMTFVKFNGESIPAIVPWREFGASLHVASRNLDILRLISKYFKLLIDRKTDSVVDSYLLANKIRGFVLQQTIYEHFLLLPNKQGLKWDDVQNSIQEIGTRYRKNISRYAMLHMNSYIDKMRLLNKG